MTTAAAATERHRRIAIVGSGPAGFYAAGHLLSQVDGVSVDMFDRLATPWGLVRAGVAPDHPKIKTVTRVYEKTARHPAFRFWGHVEIGVDLAHDELAAAYDAIIYATGAATGRRLGIPGERLPGAHTAPELVAWYNGHPDVADSTFDFSCRRAVVIGNGNVALDVARMLALTPAELAVTDTADHALAALAASRIKEIIVLGRRGPAQAAYTNPELRELAELAGADVVVAPDEVVLDAVTSSALDRGELDATTRTNVELATRYAHAPLEGKPKRIVLRFCVSPVEIVGDGRVEGVRVVRNHLLDDGTGRLAASPGHELPALEAGLVVASVGYRGSAIPGVPFDDRRATIPNVGGRVLDLANDLPLPGVYTAGWVKRGPSGVIGTNKRCAQETVAALIDDLEAGRLSRPVVDPEPLLAGLRDRGVPVVGYAGWERIDAHERSLGEQAGRPRVKLVRRTEHLHHSGEHPVTG
jgi:ferredoxin--NADP+ reductase